MSLLTKEAAGREIATMRDEILQVLDHAMHPATALLTMTEVFALYVLDAFPRGLRQNKVQMLAEQLSGLIEFYEARSQQ